MSDQEIEGEYEANNGVAIIRAFEKLDPMSIPAVLVANHGPFSWGANAPRAAENAWMLEAVARFAYLTVGINSHVQEIGKSLHDRHFLRKHGRNAYYGQARTKE